MNDQTDEVDLFDSLVRKAMRDGMTPDRARKVANELMSMGMGEDNGLVGIVRATPTQQETNHSPSQLV